MKILSFALSPPPQKKMTKPLTRTIPPPPTIKHKSTMAQEGCSPVLVFDSPVMVLHSLVLVFTQSRFNFYTVQFYFFTQSSSIFTQSSVNF